MARGLAHRPMGEKIYGAECSAVGLTHSFGSGVPVVTAALTRADGDLTMANEINTHINGDSPVPSKPKNVKAKHNPPLRSKWIVARANDELKEMMAAILADEKANNGGYADVSAIVRGLIIKDFKRRNLTIDKG